MKIPTSCGDRPHCRFARTALPTSFVTARATAFSSIARTNVSLELTQYVPLGDSIKISRLKIRNLSARPRRLSITAYVEWVLGTARGVSAPFVITELDAETRAMLARNPFSTEYGSRVAFADLNGRQLSWTADRTEFLGRNGTLDNPAALASGRPLSNRVGAALDPCAALQTTLYLRSNGEAEIDFFSRRGIDAGRTRFP